MKTIIFKGLRIRIENPAGSIRSGVDRVTGKPWQTKMSHDYGEIIGTNGVDDDPVDVFIGPNKSAPFVYVVHQLQKQTGEWDEDKCFLGFNDAMEAKAAYYKNYDYPDLFYGSIETIPFKIFKEQVFKNGGDSMIHARMDVGVGDAVTADGMRGRGVVVEDNGSDVIIRFRNGDHIKRKKYNVTNLADNTYHSRYMSAGEEMVERENAPITAPHGTNKRIKKSGSLFCVVSDGVDKNFGCYNSKEQAESVMNGKSFIEPDIPGDMLAGKVIKSASGMPETGWTYGRRTAPVGHISTRTLSGFPSGKGGGAGALPTTPHVNSNPQLSTRSKVRPATHLTAPMKPAVPRATPKATLPSPPKVTSIKKYAAPRPMDVPKPMTIKAPKPANVIKPDMSHKTLDADGEWGEPNAGAYQHAHIEPEFWFHPPSEKRPKRVPTDDVGEKDDRFFDVTKRKQAHTDRMKRLKRAAPGGLPPLIPAVTTLGTPLQFSASKNKDRLLDIIPRNMNLRVPHQIAYTKGVKARGNRGMRRAFNSACI
jgi:hypothetical protein